MSHFTVLVIGPDHETTLAPFSENHEVEPYFIPMSVAEIEARKMALLPTVLIDARTPKIRKLLALAESAIKIKSIGEAAAACNAVRVLADLPAVTLLDVAQAHEQYEHEEMQPGRAVVVDGVPGLMSVRNEQGYWDWFSVGGRWAGFFPVRQGAMAMLGVAGYNSPRGWVPGATHLIGTTAERALQAQLAAYSAQPHYAGDLPHFQKQVAKYKACPRADIVRLSDVDFTFARDEAEKNAREEFAQWAACFEGHGQPEAWAVVRDRVKACETSGDTDSRAIAGTLAEARREYAAQPTIAEWQKTEIGKWGSCPVNEYGFDVEAFALRRRAGALRPYAYVLNGVWHGRGEMGWWGCSNDRVGEDAWTAEVDAMYLLLPDDTMLTLVDCHT